MKTRSMPLIVTLAFSATLAALAAPPPKKPDPKAPAVVPVPAPAPIVPRVVVPQVVVPPGKPAAPAFPTLFCGVEIAHPAHRFRGRNGRPYRCPGKVAGPGPKGPPRRP